MVGGAGAVRIASSGHRGITDPCAWRLQVRLLKDGMIHVTGGSRQPVPDQLARARDRIVCANIR